jgi:hypothetical protein
MSEIDRSSWWRSSNPPLDWSVTTGHHSGRVTLPDHLAWSGPSPAFDLDDPAELRLMYATVLREGTDDDIRAWIHQPTLLVVWDSLWLPAAVHDAWDDWIREHRVHVAV